MSPKIRQFSGFHLIPEDPDEEAGWRPRADVYRAANGWLVKFELAGVPPEEIRVQAEGCRITVSGHLRDARLEEGCSHYSMEIAYNRFERTIQLPCDLVNPKIEVESRHGILYVRVQTEER